MFKNLLIEMSNMKVGNDREFEIFALCNKVIQTVIESKEAPQDIDIYINYIKQKCVVPLIDLGIDSNLLTIIYKIIDVMRG